MFSGEFPLNFWCVAGRTEDFTHDLRPLRLFGRDVVFFRRLDAGAVRFRKLVAQMIAAERG